MNCRISQGALAVGSIGVLVNIVDVIGSARPEPHHAFAALVALGAGAELLKDRRPGAARALHVAASVLLVVAGSVAGYGAWAALFKGSAYDWLDLVLGVLVVLYVVAGAGQLLARQSRRAPKSRRNADMISG
ncbi:hypothetical protein OH809_17415 [Streptomyces sp. NBC_00873]|uniref:hypothetical protein n=1 Tax=unclassified Streptomyces TaxID=2593676 RepID=UPI0038709579|nr:hypothetical protein OH809_17415 [Streptomyces sp. NBC_00873]WTA45689.1 hypothetical protein OH821_26270 [Streptomyces sp. NBC_00842]